MKTFALIKVFKVSEDSLGKNNKGVNFGYETVPK